MKTTWLPILSLLAVATSHGFPPAPYYTLKGIVRDQTGQVIRAQGASVILLKGAAEAGRAVISPVTLRDQNYELSVRIDQARATTSLYTARAVPAEGLFSLAVELGGQRFYPIEVKGNLTAGKGGETVRLDLTLGEDADGDGLPDAWEQWQLYQAGHFPDGEGVWPIGLIDRDGDFDGDGHSNHQEYLAGTFAGDASERFDITITSKADTRVQFEFFAITGKSYTLERSTDLLTWTRVPFSAGAAVPAADAPLPAGTESFTATAVGILPAACAPGADAARELYRLTVR
jgi:hypothetical protein